MFYCHNPISTCEILFNAGGNLCVSGDCNF